MAQIVDIHGNARPFITGVSESDLEHTAAIVGKLNNHNKTPSFLSD